MRYSEKLKLLTNILYTLLNDVNFDVFSRLEVVNILSKATELIGVGVEYNINDLVTSKDGLKEAIAHEFNIRNQYIDYEEIDLKYPDSDEVGLSLTYLNDGVTVSNSVITDDFTLVEVFNNEVVNVIHLIFNPIDGLYYQVKQKVINSIN